MSDDQQQKQVHSQVKLENKTEHVLHITLAGGDVVSVPPAAEGQAQTVSFDNAEERQRFEQALQTETVQQWIREQHLVVHGAGGGAPNAQAPDPAASPTSPARRAREKE